MNLTYFKLPVIHVLFLGIVIVACGDPTGPRSRTVPSPPDVRPWVAGTAANRVDSRGHFIFPIPAAPGTEPIITPMRAADFGRAYVRTFLSEASPISVPGAVSLQAALLAEHGAQIPWQRLEAVRSAVYFAEALYEPLPANVPMPIRRAFGPYYVMSLAADGLLVTSFGVAAYSTDLSIAPDGRVQMPLHSGNEFRGIVGIALHSQRPVPVWPEEAVQQVSRATGALIIEVPRLITLGHQYSPRLSRWEMRLDRNIRLSNAATGQEVQSNILYVGLEKGDSLSWFVPQQEQPSEAQFTYSIAGGREHTITLRFRADVPIWYDPVVRLP